MRQIKILNTCRPPVTNVLRWPCGHDNCSCLISLTTGKHFKENDIMRVGSKESVLSGDVDIIDLVADDFILLNWAKEI